MSQKVVIFARRYNRRSLKIFKKLWPGNYYRVPCEECRLSCYISQSSKDAMDERTRQDLETIVVCDNCHEKAGLSGEEPEITTEGQHKEVRELAMKLDTRARRN